MGIYDKDVKGLLGEENFEIILDDVRAGKISDKQMIDICAQLHPDVRGNHQRRDGAKSDAREWREILSDWFRLEMYNLDRAAALKKLIDTFEHRDVGLAPLARKLKVQKTLSSFNPDTFESVPELRTIILKVHKN